MEERTLDQLAFAGALTVEEGGADRHTDGGAGGVIGDGWGEPLRLTMGPELAVASDETRVGGGGDIGGSSAGHGAARTEAGEVAVDQARVDGGERLVVDAEPLSDAGAVVDGDDIDLREHSVEELAAFLGGQVDREAALSSVEGLEAFALTRDDGTRGAIRVASERFDFDDVRAKIGEEDAVEGHGDDERELEDSNAIEWACGVRHVRLPRQLAVARA